MLEAERIFTLHPYIAAHHIFICDMERLIAGKPLITQGFLLGASASAPLFGGSHSVSPRFLMTEC
ncbi:MAG: hypothetical protein ACRBCK_05690 [Alphaproteobacteria bacterium]